jgi:hypothetical protein
VRPAPSVTTVAFVVFIVFLPETNAFRPGRPARGRRTWTSVLSMRSSTPGGPGVGEDAGEGAEPQARAVRDGEPAGREQGADLMDGAGDGGAVHLAERGDGGVRELVAQVNQGDDDTVGDRKVVVRAGAGCAQAVVTPAFAQPGLLRGHPVAREAGDELATAARLQAGEDTLAHGRAGPS